MKCTCEYRDQSDEMSLMWVCDSFCGRMVDASDLERRLDSARVLLRDIYSITSYGDALASMRLWCKPDHNPYSIDSTRKQIRTWLAEDGEE